MAQVDVAQGSDASALKELGNKAFAEENYVLARQLYTDAISIDCSNAVLFSNRAACETHLHNYESALLDSDRCIALAPRWGRGFLRKGAVLLAQNKLEQCKHVLLCGLSCEPRNPALMQTLEEVNVKMVAAGYTHRKVRTVTDDFECVLCMKLFYEPVTTACGHTFCRSCLVRSLDHSSHCPICRATLHLSASHPVSVTLKCIVESQFPEEYAARVAEMKEDTLQTEDKMPLFMLNQVACPGSDFNMHIFEPRYRLMIRRCMEGNKRFGLVNCKAAPGGRWEPVEIGSCLEISNIELMADGRSHVFTKVSRRFKILQIWDCDGGYSEGKILWYDDEPVSEAQRVQDEEAAAALKQHVHQMATPQGGSRCGGLRQLADSLRGADVPKDASLFSWWFANKIGACQQDMLEMRTAKQRLERCIAALRQTH